MENQKNSNIDEGPNFKDQTQNDFESPQVFGAPSEVRRPKSVTDQVHTVAPPVPLAEGHLIVDATEASSVPGMKSQAVTTQGNHKKHMIWALALVCVALIVAGGIVAAVLVLTLGDKDPPATTLVIFYVQVTLSPFTELLSGSPLGAFEDGTENFYQSLFPEDILSGIKSQVTNQSVDEQELNALVRVEGSWKDSIGEFDPTALSDAITDNPSQYIEALRILDPKAFARVSLASAIPADPSTTSPSPAASGSDPRPIPTSVQPPNTPTVTPPVPQTTAANNGNCQSAFVVESRVDNTAAVVVGSNVNANPAPTGDNLYNGGRAVYYQFTTPTGQPRRVRVSTCTPETDFETGVYVSDFACDDEGVLRFIEWSSNEPDTSCEYGSRGATVSFVAEPVTTYRIAVAGRVPTESGTFGLSVNRLTLVDNDECQNAELVTPKDDDASPLLTSSTESAAPAGDNRFNNAPVVYFKFSITGLDRRIRLSTCGPDTDFQTEIFVTSSSCDSQGARFIAFQSEPDYGCDSSGMASTVSFVALADTVYTVAVSGRLLTEKGSFSFGVTRFTQVQNDECQNAMRIVPLDDNSSQLLVGSTASAQPAGEDRFENSPVVYYQFAIEGLNRRVRLSTCSNATDFATQIYVTDFPCDQHGARFIDFTSKPDFECDPSGKAASVEFVAVAGTVYIAGVAGRLLTDSGTFGLSFARFVKLLNDECDNAETILPSVNDTAPLLVNSTVMAQPAGDDRFNGSPIVYYQFTVGAGPVRSIRLSTCAVDTDFPTVIYVSDSPCDPLGLRFIDFTSEPDLLCDPTGNAASVEFVAVAGTTYRVGLAGRGPTDTGSFGLSASYVPLIQ